MSLFLAGFVALIVLALWLLLPPLLLRKPAAHAGAPVVDGGRANLSVLREQLAALDVERASGVLDAEQHRLARIDIERRALEEQQAAERPAVVARSGKTAWVLGVSIPLFAVLLYGLLGNPQAFAPPSQTISGSAPPGEVTVAQVEAMVDKLAQRMESKTVAEVGDEQGWTMLARSYAVLQRYPEASRAFARARALSPDNAQLLADHADVLAMTQGQSLVGEPMKLVERALRLEPGNIKALALAGSGAYERKDIATALKYWVQAQKLAPPGSEFAVGLENSIQQARAAAPPADAAAAAAAATAAKPPTADLAIAQGGAANAQTAGPAAAAISGVVQLAGPLASRVKPDDTLYVFARAAQGPRMPLAILKRKAGDLPLTFRLDDSSAMSPELRLSRFSSVVVGARISRSGDAMPRSGDLVGQLGPVASGSGKLVLVIDGVQP